MNPVIISFCVYLLLMLWIGWKFMGKSSDKLEGYLLGGRGVGSWVTAMSAQASDMSGWLLMGLPGAIYMMRSGGGWGDIWCAIGLACGTAANWIIVAPRLRAYSNRLKSLTLNSFLSERFRDKSGKLRIIASIATLLFFTVYVSTGLVAAGKLFQSMFGISYQLGAIMGCIVVLGYTFMGGYMAVCWTDLIQGLLMFFALVAAPVICILQNRTVDFTADWASRNLSAFPDGVTLAAVMGLLSAFVWGLGYFGQPHILTRFMSAKSNREIKRATVIAMIWVVISLGMAALVALVAMPDAVTNMLWGEVPSAKEAERIFILMVSKCFNPWIGGVLLSALLAAIMSTVDSQLLVCSSALTEDICRHVIKHNLDEKGLVKMSRLFVFVIALLALGIALLDLDTIFAVVKFAWGGFGASFGPVVLFALYSRRCSQRAAVLAMSVGMTVMLGWYFAGLNKYMYEILPGFIAGCIACYIGTKIWPQMETQVMKEFDDVNEEMRGGK